MNKFIFKGVVKENLDPKGLGRIRIEPEDWITSDTVYITEYLNKYSESKDKWNAVSDPFMFTPFLPNHINMIPQVGESVHIFYTDPESTFIDGFYMPMSVPDRGYSDTSSAEHMLAQSKQGLTYKKAKDIIKDTGEYVKKKYDGAVIKNEDFAITSRGNSDVIWRPKSVVIRAGKINEKVSQKQREPIRDENPAIIQVSKFDYVTEKKDGETKYETKKRISHIEVLLEYYIEDLTSQNGFTGVIYIYKMAKNEGITESIYFNHTTNIPETDKELLFTKYVTGDTLVELSTNIRNSIKEIMSIGVSGIGSLDHLIKHPSNVDPSKMTSIYPFYFRPTEQQYQDNNTNSTYINEVIDRIRIRTRKGYGLLFDEKGDDTPTKNVEYTEQIITKIDKPNKNIIVLSDTNYFLAYGNNIPTEDKGIDFSKVSNYEISQTEINENIDSNTYSMVRGEKLHELLDTIYLFLVSHVHNPAEPAVVLPSVKQDLEQKFQDFKQNILSQKIRIN